MNYNIREAKIEDVPFITAIYNQGIEDRAATIKSGLSTIEEMDKWLTNREKRYKVVVIEKEDGCPLGWASINEFHSRCCYSGVGDLSIYIERGMRGKGLGRKLLISIIETAKKQDFHKLVLSTLDFNETAKGLYRSSGFREVGTYMEQGLLEGKFVNVTIMEKLL